MFYANNWAVNLALLTVYYYPDGTDKFPQRNGTGSLSWKEGELTSVWTGDLSWLFPCFVIALLLRISGLLPFVSSVIAFCSSRKSGVRHGVEASIRFPSAQVAQQQLQPAQQRGVPIRLHRQAVIARRRRLRRDHRVDQRFALLEQGMGRFDQRLQALEEGMGRFDQRLQALEEGMGRFDQRLQALEEGMGRFDQRLQALEEGMGRFDQRLQVLEEGMREIRNLLQAGRGRQLGGNEGLGTLMLQNFVKRENVDERAL